MSPRRRRRPRPESENSRSTQPLSGFEAVEIEIDLHGMRALEADTQIKIHLQRCHNARLHIAKIIHGHGTGALKQLTRDLLSKSDLVVRHYPAPYGDGGDGVTIAELDYGGHRPYNRRANNSIIPKALQHK